MNEITRIQSTLQQGDSLESERLLPLVHDELRKLAASRLKEGKPGQMLEAIVRLGPDTKLRTWNRYRRGMVSQSLITGLWPAFLSSLRTAVRNNP